MRSLLVLMLASIFTLNTYAQYKSDSIFIKKKERLKKVLHDYPPDNLTETYSNACVGLALIYAISDNKDSALYYLNTALDKCDPTNSECLDIYHPNILGFYHFRKLKNTSEWKRFENRIVAAYKMKFQAANYELSIDLIKASGADYSIRLLLQSVKTPELLQELRKIDSLNVLYIKSVVKKHGFPGISLVEQPASDAAFLLVQHADKDTTFQKEVLNSMNKLLTKNDLYKPNYGLLYDRIMVNTRKQQYYGTQFMKTSEGFKFFPIVDSSNVDKRRKELGMEPLIEYKKSLEQYGASFK